MITCSYNCLLRIIVIIIISFLKPYMQTWLLLKGYNHLKPCDY